MADARGWFKSFGGRGCSREKKVLFMVWLAAKLQVHYRCVKAGESRLDRPTRGSEQKQIVSVAEIMQSGNRIEFPIKRCEVKIGQKAGSWCSKCDALRGAQRLPRVFVGEFNALSEEVKKVVIRIDEIRKLREKQFVVHGRKIAGDVALRNEQGAFHSREDSSDFPLATVQAKPPQAVCIRVLRKPFMKPGAQKSIEEQINKPFFPGIDVQSSALSAEVAMQCDSGPKRKRFPSQRAVNLRKVMQARTCKVIKIAFVGRGE